MSGPALYSHLNVSDVCSRLGDVKQHKNGKGGSAHMLPVSPRIQCGTLDEQRWDVVRVTPGTPAGTIELSVNDDTQYRFWAMFVNRMRDHLTTKGIRVPMRSPITTPRGKPPTIQFRLSPDVKIFRMLSEVESGAPPTQPGTVSDDLHRGMPVTVIVRVDGVWVDRRECGLVVHVTDILTFPDEQQFSADEPEPTDTVKQHMPVSFTETQKELRQLDQEADDALNSDEGDYQTEIFHSRAHVNVRRP